MMMGIEKMSVVVLISGEGRDNNECRSEVTKYFNEGDQ